MIYMYARRAGGALGHERAAHVQLGVMLQACTQLRKVVLIGACTAYGICLLDSACSVRLHTVHNVLHIAGGTHITRAVACHAAWGVQTTRWAMKGLRVWARH